MKLRIVSHQHTIVFRRTRQHVLDVAELRNVLDVHCKASDNPPSLCLVA